MANDGFCTSVSPQPFEALGLLLIQSIAASRPTLSQRWNIASKERRQDRDEGASDDKQPDHRSHVPHFQPFPPVRRQYAPGTVLHGGREGATRLEDDEASCVVRQQKIKGRVGNDTLILMPLHRELPLRKTVASISLRVNVHSNRSGSLLRQDIFDSRSYLFCRTANARDLN